MAVHRLTGSVMYNLRAYVYVETLIFLMKAYCLNYQPFCFFFTNWFDDLRTTGIVMLLSSEVGYHLYGI